MTQEAYRNISVVRFSTIDVILSRFSMTDATVSGDRYWQELQIHKTAKPVDCKVGTACSI